MRYTIIFTLISICTITLVPIANGKPLQLKEVDTNANETSDQTFTKSDADNLQVIFNYLLEVLQGNRTLQSHGNLLGGNFSAENLTRIIGYHGPMLMPPLVDGYPVSSGYEYGYPYTVPKYPNFFKNGHIITGLNGWQVPVADNSLDGGIDGHPVAGNSLDGGIDGHPVPVVDNHLDIGLNGHPVVLGNEYVEPSLDGYPVSVENNQLDSDTDNNNNNGLLAQGRRFSITFRKY